MKKNKWITASLTYWAVICGALYLIFAFANWNINPGEWSDAARNFLGILMVFSGAMSAVAGSVEA